MRTTLALDDELVAQGQELTGIKEKSRLIFEALALLGGSAPDIGQPPRRGR